MIEMLRHTVLNEYPYIVWATRTRDPRNLNVLFSNPRGMNSREAAVKIADLQMYRPDQIFHVDICSDNSLLLGTRFSAVANLRAPEFSRYPINSEALNYDKFTTFVFDMIRILQDKQLFPDSGSIAFLTNTCFEGNYLRFFASL